MRGAEDPLSPSTELSVPQNSPDCNRRVHSHFLPQSQLVFPLPAVICHWFLGHERWLWAQTHRMLETASRHLCRSDRFLHPCGNGEQMTGGLASAGCPLDVLPPSGAIACLLALVFYFNLSDLQYFVCSFGLTSFHSKTLLVMREQGWSFSL